MIRKSLDEFCLALLPMPDPGLLLADVGTVLEAVVMALALAAAIATKATVAGNMFRQIAKRTLA